MALITVMLGFVTTRHLVTHGATIVRYFGLRVYLRCIVNSARHLGRATFLEALAPCTIRR